MDLKVNHSMNSNFRARLVVSPEIKEKAGKTCAIELEKALPAIRKIANEATNIDSIYLNPLVSIDGSVSHALSIIAAKGFLPPLACTVYEENGKNQYNANKDYSEHLIDTTELVVNTFLNRHNLRKSENTEKSSGNSFLGWIKKIFN